MQVSDLNNNVKSITKKSTSKKQPVQLKDMLSKLLNVIEDFEKNGKIDFKVHRERLDILKDLVTSFIKDDEQKRIISGGQ
jgi:polyhydroxyalkanoate synthesis regulator phasin